MKLHKALTKEYTVSLKTIRDINLWLIRRYADLSYRLYSRDILSSPYNLDIKEITDYYKNDLINADNVRNKLTNQIDIRMSDIKDIQDALYILDGFNTLGYIFESASIKYKDKKNKYDITLLNWLNIKRNAFYSEDKTITFKFKYRQNNKKIEHNDEFDIDIRSQFLRDFIIYITLNCKVVTMNCKSISCYWLSDVPLYEYEGFVSKDKEESLKNEVRAYYSGDMTKPDYYDYKLSSITEQLDISENDVVWCDGERLWVDNAKCQLPTSFAHDTKFGSYKDREFRFINYQSVAEKGYVDEVEKHSRQVTTMCRIEIIDTLYLDEVQIGGLVMDYNTQKPLSFKNTLNGMMGEFLSVDDRFKDSFYSEFKIYGFPIGLYYNTDDVKLFFFTKSLKYNEKIVRTQNTLYSQSFSLYKSGSFGFKDECVLVIDVNDDDYKCNDIIRECVNKIKENKENVRFLSNTINSRTNMVSGNTLKEQSKGIENYIKDCIERTPAYREQLKEKSQQIKEQITKNIQSIEEINETNKQLQEQINDNISIINSIDLTNRQLTEQLNELVNFIEKVLK